MSLNTQLKEYARKHGVELIGVTSAEPFAIPDKRIVLYGGKMRGRIAGSIDPRKLMPNAKSVVVFAYYTLSASEYQSERPMNERVVTVQSSLDTPRGWWGQGTNAYCSMIPYCKKVIETFLKKNSFNAWISRKGESTWGADNKFPLKPMAVRAGLTLYGKNSVTHNYWHGSYLEPGIVVTDAPLEVEEHDYKRSDCGSCHECIDACPTGAIVEPYRLDETRCICRWGWGYPVPRELREKMGNRLFRCEICQAVCPMNQNLKPREGFPVKIDNKPENPELIPLILGDRDYYTKSIPRFAKEAGFQVIRRNAIIAAGNVGSRKAIPALKQALKHANPLLRTYAAWAVGKIGGEQANNALNEALRKERDPVTRAEIEAALT
jgi:epoxyqueuosine reductase